MSVVGWGCFGFSVTSFHLFSAERIREEWNFVWEDIFGQYSDFFSPETRSLFFHNLHHHASVSPCIRDDLLIFLGGERGRMALLIVIGEDPWHVNYSSSRRFRFRLYSELEDQDEEKAFRSGFEFQSHLILKKMTPIGRKGWREELSPVGIFFLRHSMIATLPPVIQALSCLFYWSVGERESQ